MNHDDLANAGDEVTLVNDGDGIALIGDARVIDRFLSSNEIESRPLDLQRATRLAGAGSDLVASASTVAENSGRWIKLTEKSARALQQGNAMTGSAPGVSRAVLTSGGKTSHILEFSTKGIGVLANPALLTGAAGVMNQVAMQQAMDEITDYLKVIDAKVDAVIRAQKDAVFADLIGVELAIEEALAVRETVGRVSEVTWSKIQGSSTAITRTQAYALRQIADYADALEKSRGLAGAADDVKKAASEVNDWLAVIARCVQLLDAVAVLEMDRVLESSPDDIDKHRLALRTARAKRLEVIGTATQRLLERIDDAAGSANAKVLLHPTSARVVIGEGTRIEQSLVDFHHALGIANERDAIIARRWRDAATDLKERAVETGAAGVEGAKRIGESSAGRAKQAATGLSSKVTELRRKQGEGDDSE